METKMKKRKSNSKFLPVIIGALGVLVIVVAVLVVTPSQTLQSV